MGDVFHAACRVDVTDPELIKRITSHPDIDRIHGVPTKDKPW